MVNQSLLTTFIALTTLAVLIQTGIIAGLYFVTMKMSRQADRVTAETRRLFDPLRRIIGTLETASVRISEFSRSSQDQLKRAELHLDRTLDRVRRRIA
jgi:hypothetical protein